MHPNMSGSLFSLSYALVSISLNKIFVISTRLKAADRGTIKTRQPFQGLKQYFSKHWAISQSTKPSQGYIDRARFYPGFLMLDIYPYIYDRSLIHTYNY
jgi:hypothetical protein